MDGSGVYITEDGEKRELTEEEAEEVDRV